MSQDPGRHPFMQIDSYGVDNQFFIMSAFIPRKPRYYPEHHSAYQITSV